eukprot:2218060-Amphidinium_carterae.1
MLGFRRLKGLKPAPSKKTGKQELKQCTPLQQIRIDETKRGWSVKAFPVSSPLIMHTEAASRTLCWQDLPSQPTQLRDEVKTTSAKPPSCLQHWNETFSKTYLQKEYKDC